MADRKELENKLMKATTVEEIKAIVTEGGCEISDEDAQRILGKFKVSADELDTMSGGSEGSGCSSCQARTYADGCAATVEKGSYCWGTDGGCVLMNVKYLDA